MTHFDAKFCFNLNLALETTTKQGSNTLASNTSYHPNGAASLLSYGNGYDFVRQINSLKQITSMSTTNGRHTALFMDYSYDPLDPIVPQTDN